MIKNDREREPGELSVMRVTGPSSDLIAVLIAREDRGAPKRFALVMANHEIVVSRFATMTLFDGLEVSA